MSVNIKKNGTLTKLAGLYANINLRLSQLLDTDISSLEDGQILAYNNETGKWENQEAPAGVEVVDNLTTQSATSALSANQGYVLNNALAGKANAADVLPTLITSPANKQILSYDSSSSKWVNSVNGNTVLLGTADPAANLGKEGDLYVKLSSPSYGNSYRIHTRSTGGESASLDVDTIADGAVVATQNINYHWPVQTFPDFSTNYKSSNWIVTITSDNVYGREKGSTISWPYYQTNDVTLTINPPSVYGIFVKSRGIWIQIGKSPVENFAELKDTNFNNLQNGQLAVYNSTTGKWENGNVTKSDVGLGNVGNFKAVSTVASQELTSTEQANARANIGAGTATVFILTLDEDENENLVIDKTVSETLAAYRAGQILMLNDKRDGEDFANYYLINHVSDYDGYFYLDFSHMYGTILDSDHASFVGFYLSSNEDTDTWDVYEDNYSAAFVKGTIYLENNQYKCTFSPNTLHNAFDYNYDTTIFLEYGVDGTVYTLTYHTNLEYHFSTIIKNINGFKLRTFIFTTNQSAGSSWANIAMTEVPITSVEVVDNLTTQDATKALSANQGKVLKDAIDAKSSVFTITLTENLDPETGEVTFTSDKLPSEVVAARNNGSIIRLTVVDEAKYYFDLSIDHITEEETGFIFTNVRASSNHQVVFVGFNFIKDANSDTWASIEFFNPEFDEPIFAEIEESNGEYSCDVDFNTFDDAYYYSKNITVEFESEFFRMAKYDTSEHTFYFVNTVSDSSGIKTRTFVMVGDSIENEWTSITLTESSNGSSILTLTISSDEQTGELSCDKLPSEVAEAYSNGAILQAVMEVDGSPTILALIIYELSEDGTCIFGTSAANQGAHASISGITIILTKDGSNDAWASITPTLKIVGTPLIATLSKNGNTYSCDKQPRDFKNALAANCGVVLQYTNESDVKFNYTLLGYKDVYLFAAIVPTDPTNATIQMFRLDPLGYTEWNSITLLEYNLGSSEFSLEQTATTSTSANTVYTFTDARITSSSVIDVYADIFGVNPSNIQVANGSCTVTFPKQATAQSMTCRIYIK